MDEIFGGKKLFGGENFRKQARFSAVLCAEILSDKVYIYVLILKKYLVSAKKENHLLKCYSFKPTDRPIDISHVNEILENEPESCLTVV